MPQDTAELVIGANGNVYVAPVGTVAPTDATAPWAAGWVDIGYTSEDGVTFSDSKTVDNIPVWQSFYPARRIITERDSSVSFVLRQWNADTVKFAFNGGDITTTAGPPAHYMYEPPDPGPIDERALGIEWRDGTKTYRLIIPKGLVTEAVETNLVRTAAADLPITFGVIGTASAKPWYIRTNDAAFA